MKYIVILGDGMADYPIPELGNKTTLQFANKPNMDFLASHGIMGMVKTVPEGMNPGSDIANLSVMGYDPKVYYTGRSPLEAISMGIELSENDVSFRCNMVTLSDENDYFQKTMIDYSSDEISSGEASELINEVNLNFKSNSLYFYPGISYRHCLVWNNGPKDFIPSPLTPPHDITGKKIGPYLPSCKNGVFLLDMMEKSSSFLPTNPVNIKRVKNGLRPANSIWIWGEGKKLVLSSFEEKYSLKGSVISAVDLVKGIGICAGLKVVSVEGATGNIHTNFKGKALAALEELKNGIDFVYVHIEAPDECGHRNEMENKIKSIEFIDNLVVKTIYEGMKELHEEFSIMIMPDHPTPLSLRTHTSDPVPFIIYRSNSIKESPYKGYDEINAGNTGLYFKNGYNLMDYFIKETI